MQQKPFAVQGGDTSRRSRRDGLAVVGVLHVAGGEDAFDRGLRRSRLDLDVAFGVERQLFGEKFRVGVMADRQEESRDVDLPLRAVVPAQQRARYARVVAQHLGGVVLEQHFDVRRVEHPLLHRLRGAQVGFAHDQVDLAAERCEVGGLLAGRVAAAHHGHVLFAVEKSVARGAGADALPAEFGLGRETEVFGRGSRGDDQRFGLDLLLAVDHDVERTRREVGARDVARADVGAEPLGLPAHQPHQVGTAHAVGMSREILDVGGRRQLSARFDAFVKHRLEVGARGVDGGGGPCGAAADDQDSYLFFHGIGCCLHVSIIIRSKFRQASSQVVEFRPAAVFPHPDDAFGRRVVDDLVFGRDDVASLAVDQPHPRWGLDLGASFAEIPGPGVLRPDYGVVLSVHEPESLVVLDADQPFEDVARPAVARQAAVRGVDGLRVADAHRVGRPADLFAQAFEGRAVSRRAEMRVVVAQRHEPPARPAQVSGPEVVVREVQLPQGRFEGVERREQPLRGFRVECFGERFARGKVL